MIITRIEADNVLKYRHIDLDGLPRDGVITISGQNESGKSTIGETVCFALFGRTFSIGENDLSRIIRWGESRCSVKLGFVVNGKDYGIARFLDNEGHHGARLYLAENPDQPIAKGVNAVSDALNELLGYQFEEFIESFYLAQREITTPHPHSHAIKTMAGIATLERIAGELEQENRNDQRRLPDMDEQISAVEEDIDALAIDPELMPDLQARRASVERAWQSLRQNDTDLAQAAENYQEAAPAMRRSRRLKWLSRLLALLTLLGAGMVGGAWYLINRVPAADATARLLDLLKGLPGWNEQHISLLAPATAALAVLFLLFWIWSIGLARRSRSLQRNGTDLAEHLTTATDTLTQVQTMLAELKRDPAFTDEPDVTREELEADVEETVLAPEDDSTAKTTLDIPSIDEITKRLLRQCKLKRQALEPVMSTMQERISNSLKILDARKSELDEAIEAERNRLARASSLEDMLQELKHKLEQTRQQIHRRELADELIHGAARHISQRFNKDLRELASRTLPLLTEGRYEHLHIDTDLNVRAFSSQKRDFMDLDEISSGTQRQIMLAVRLALAQELVNTSGGGRQFIFLDEPFAFFDPARTRKAMDTLPQLSDEISQIWVIAQEFPEDTAHDLSIVCAREYETLTSNQIMADQEGPV